MKDPDSKLTTDLLLSHGDWLRGLAIHLMGDEQDAEDLVQQTWFEALRRPPRHTRGVRAWLAVVARRLARSSRAREKRRERRQRAAARPEAIPSAAQVFERLTLQRTVVDAVLGLEEPYRSSLLLRYYEGLSPSAIAEQLAVPVATVKSRLQRGLTQLRGRLESHRGDGRSWHSLFAPLLGTDLAPAAPTALAGGSAAGARTMPIKICLLAAALSVATFTLIFFGSTFWPDAGSDSAETLATTPSDSSSSGTSAGASELLRSDPLAASAQLASTARIEWQAPYLGPLPGTEPKGLSTTLVRQRRSGLPLAGVTVRRYLESIDPRVRSAPFLGESRTDAFGLVSSPVKEGTSESHWVFELPGHAVRESYGHLAGHIVELSPGRELHGRIFDPLGRAAPDIPVQLFLGCGHSPAVRRAQTDARGRFSMRDVAPLMGTLWISAPRLAAHNVIDPIGSERQPFVIQADPGVVLAAAVTDERGRPLPDVVVRSSQETRGPTAVTGPDGRFELEGYDPAAGLWLCGSDGRKVYAGEDSFDLSHPPQLLYPARTDGADGQSPLVPFSVEVLDAENGMPVADAIVKLREPGRELIRWFDLGSDEEPRVPPGDYFVSVGDWCSSHVAPALAITLNETSGDTCRITARRQPLLVVQAKGFPHHRGAHLELVLAREGLLRPLDLDEKVYLPAAVKAVVRAEADGLVRHFPVGPATDGRREVAITWPAPKRIAVESGGRYHLSLRCRASHQIRGDMLETHASGPVTLVVSDEALGEQEIQVDLPQRPGAEVRVAAAALRPAGEIRVVLPDGSPLAKAPISIDEELEHLDEQGRLVSWRVKAGAALRIQREGCATLSRTLEGPGPQVLRWGSARLELEVKGPREFVTYVDGDLFTTAGEHLSVAGLDAGPHTVIVAARGRIGRAFRVTLRAGESHLVELDLAKNP